MRVAALDKTSGLRMVLVPDRLLIAELAAIGPFALVPEFLWHRRYFGLTSRARQRRNSFPGGAPLYTYLPITVQHGSALLYHFALRREGLPTVSSWEGYKVARDFVAGRLAYRLKSQRRSTKRPKRTYRTIRKSLSNQANKLKRNYRSAHGAVRSGLKKRYRSSRKALRTQARNLKKKYRSTSRAVRNRTSKLYRIVGKPLTRRFWERNVRDNARKLYRRAVSAVPNRFRWPRD
jgi:hypothetical protein